MPDVPEHGPDDAARRIGRSLQATADGLDLEPIEAAVTRRRSVRRRRRRSMLAGVAGVLAVGAVGAVVASERGDDTIELAAPETTAPPTTLAESADGATTGTSATTTVPITTPPTLAPLAAPGAGASVAVFDGADSTAFDTDDSVQLLPWADGFLRISVEYPPQPLTPLPEEISALFPEEVNALFPDGLPPTIQEATKILSEAGLLDEVTAVLSEHPEASEAVYANPAPPPVLRASYTIDGTEWRTVELDIPTPYPGQFRVSGDRLMTWTTEYDDAEDPRSSPTAVRLVIAWTDDLVDWTTVTHPLTVTSDPRPYVRDDVQVSGVALVGDRWIAHVQRDQWFDVEPLLPPGVLEEYWSTGYGIGYDDDGVTIESYDESGRPGESQTFTWAELGLDGNPEAEFRREQPETSAATLVTAVLDGPVSEVPPPPGAPWGNVFGVGDTFVFGSERVYEGTDAGTWTEIDGLPFDFLSEAVQVDGGVLLIGEGPSGPAAVLRSPDGSIRPVQLPELSQRYWLGGGSGSAAWVVELHDESEYGPREWVPVTIEVEHEGKRLALEEGPDGIRYTLTDVATGDVLVERDEPYPDGPETGPWETDGEGDVAEFVVRDDDGNEVARFPGDLIQAQYNEVYSSVETTVPAEPEFSVPERWVLATADAEHWLTVQLAPIDPETGYWPSSAAVNGDRVLHPSGDGFAITTLPTG